MNRDGEDRDPIVPPRPLLVEPRLGDLEVYSLLVRMAERTRELSARCWSIAAATALKAASGTLRALASALYRAKLRDD